MKENTLRITFSTCSGKEELPEKDAMLMNAAMEACRNAYAPYSGFKVGAALLMDDGTIIKGSNQENAAYPSGLCAERVAFFHAGSACPGKKIIAVAISAVLNNHHQPHPVSPCGDCRQVMAEFEHRYGYPIRIIMMTEKDQYVILNSVKALLPFLFSSDSLKEK
ncbi:MAG: cytidine deaminase [Bacteroidia bacterium]|nr:cytidine deaminase [Bacteroidia bacterium]